MIKDFNFMQFLAIFKLIIFYELKLATRTSKENRFLILIIRSGMNVIKNNYLTTLLIDSDY